MPSPIIFVIDDDTGVMDALRGDLSRRFSQDFTVIGESSARAGLATIHRLAADQQTVALLIVDHDMAEMTGTEFLTHAHQLHPRARRVLLVWSARNSRDIFCQ